jgi:hypothetical protein
LPFISGISSGAKAINATNKGHRDSGGELRVA